MYLMLSTKVKTLLYALQRRIFCQLFSMKKNFRCATPTADGLRWQSISFLEVFIQSETAKS